MNDKRTHPRFLCSELLQLERQHNAASPHVATVNLEDISTAGACFSSDIALEPGESVVLHYEHGDLPGTVRYCVNRGFDYCIGISFAFGCEWPSDFYQPEHLLDPRTLAGDTTRVN